MNSTTIESAVQEPFLDIEVDMGPRSHQVYFKTRDVPLTPSAEAFLTLTLLPAMKQGLDVSARGKISPRLLDAVPSIMDLVCSWDASLHRVDVCGAVPAGRDRPSGDRVGAFFSGGVDSFYTLLKHRDEITDIIFVHGFDLKLDHLALRQRTSEMLRHVGSRFGKNVIEVETNFLAFLKPYISYAELGHGAALAGIGHLLAPLFRRIYIASSYPYDLLFPWGSHPDLDPLWSTEALEFVHDGCEATRIDKVAALSKSDVALQCLRVCFGQRHANCGRCEKCVRTMINLAVVGALDRCTTFDTPLKVRNVRKTIINDDHTRIFVDENLQALEKSRRHPQLYKALRKVANRPMWRTRLIRKGRTFKRKMRRKVTRAPGKMKNRMRNMLLRAGQREQGPRRSSARTCTLSENRKATDASMCAVRVTERLTRTDSDAMALPSDGGQLTVRKGPV